MPTMLAVLPNLACVLAWIVPIIALPTSVSLICAGHGFLVTAFGFLLMAVLLGGPMKLPFRAGIYSVFVAIAVTGPSMASCLGLAALAVMLLMITEIPGRPKAFPPSETFAQLCVNHGRAYYAPAELRGEVKALKPGKNMFAHHPHGILTGGWTWNMFWNPDLHERVGGIRFLCDEGMRLKSPTFRLICDWFEGKYRHAGAATKKVIKEAMSKGESLALLPGGFQEAVLCSFGKDRVYVKKRQGFVKYCLQGGYRIIPVYSFGESDLYYTFGGMLGLRMWLGKQNIPACAMFGNPLFPLLPRPGVPLLTYVGPALELPQIDEPTQEEINKWHGAYVQALTDLFNKHKADAGRPDATLEVF